MYSVFIADDELIIRQGLKCIIDWEALGFQITGEAANGYDALNYIITNSPDLVLIDIRMPKMPGLEAVEAARKNGFKGKVIILSGYTDFKYAQSAIKNGVDYYLTKPLEEDELTETLIEIKKQLGKEEISQNTLSQYRDRAKGMILLDILANKINIENINVKDINLIADKYQVVIYENYSRHSTSLQYRFSDLLKVTNESNSSYDNIKIGKNEVILLKGTFTLNKFQEFLEHYSRELKPQQNSPLDSLFIAYGREVNSLEDIHISYQEALKLLQRRFFCEDKQHTIGFEQLPKPSSQSGYCLSPDVLNEYCDRLSGYIQASKRNQVAETLHELEHNLYNSDSGIPRIKLFLTDLYLSIKEKISHLYHSSDIAFPGNAEIIDYINSRYYLYEIMLYFTEQFDMIIRTIGNPSSEGVMDDIIHY
ncbi:MAG: response regulator, partial [Lachnospiraceae bacterium]|nr:response regulator [Lachnospiraceae bacterium]